MAISLDIPNRIVNVHWGGLAVEFFDGANGGENGDPSNTQPDIATPPAAQGTRRRRVKL